MSGFSESKDRVNAMLSLLYYICIIDILLIRRVSATVRIDCSHVRPFSGPMLKYGRVNYKSDPSAKAYSSRFFHPKIHPAKIKMEIKISLAYDLRTWLISEV